MANAKSVKTRVNPAGKPKKFLPVKESLRVYWLAYNVALETDILDLLDALAVKAYTRWDEIKGSGHSGPHLNDDVWPAVNALYMFAGPSSLEAKLIAAVQKIRAQFPGEGVKLIVQPCLGIY